MTLALETRYNARSEWCRSGGVFLAAINSSRKTQSAPDMYSTMQKFVTALCTHAHIPVTEWYIVGYGTGALWNLLEESIVQQYTDRTVKRNVLYASNEAGLCTGILFRPSVPRLSLWQNDGLFVISRIWSAAFTVLTGLFFYLVETVTNMEMGVIDDELLITGTFQGHLFMNVKIC